ncbi:MAG: GreA/GreB family elongation factor [Opitutales bacterium]|nr:GreA/GreB family elongation factor [Opitutales bacterium]MDP4659395.1 GreA/GreB family elongation factor [Opitutales bacterium]MDP4774977.1 GreA/GreB family elongation factor [Opitutales bacterium]MDP4787946.1 GreA/GreB family elongation factor [Opitutales bacterium]MDP4861590.1 GreA/GreB family elongation factor [Opitutales bacterium]
MNSLQAAIDLVATGQPAFCLHQAWGIGVVRSYDEATKRLVIDFPEQNKKAHAMDAAFFLGKIEFINPNGLIAKAYADATKAEVANLVANDPAGVVKALLAEYPTGECTSYALEANLDRVHFASLPAGKDRAAAFKAWWTKGRAAVRKDRAILVPERKGGLYALLEAPKDLGEDLFAQYEGAPNFERKLLLLEELAGAAAAETRSAATAANLDKVSADLLKEIKKLETARKRDNLPAILGGIWNRDKFFRSAVENVETVSPTASEIIALCTESDLAFVALNIPHTTEKIRSLLDLVRAHHGDRWADRAFDLLRNRDIGGTKSGSAKLVSESIAYLCDQDLAEAVASRFAQWLETRELRAPVIIWIIKNRDSKKYAAIVGRLITPALLGAILSSIDTESLESNSTARIPLANELIKDKELIANILTPAEGKKADSETIFDLTRTMMSSQGFDEMTKKALLSRLAKIEPHVQRLAKSKHSGSEAEEKELLVSKQSKELKERELEDIVKVRLPAVKEAIQIAKEHGDLKENSEYKMARQDHDTLAARRAELDALLKKARVTDFSEAKTDAISVGSSIVLRRGSDQTEFAYDLLGAWDGEPEKNILSYISPLAKQFLNHKAGETFTTNINGKAESWTVVKIGRWVDKR